METMDAVQGAFGPQDRKDALNAALSRTGASINDGRLILFRELPMN
jgi:hypothetical protein